MFEPFNIEDIDLDAAIASAFDDLRQHRADSDEYRKTVDQLMKLHELKNSVAQLNLNSQTAFAAQQLAEDQNAYQEEQDARPFYQRVDANTVFTVVGNLLIGVLVIKYEQTGVISSKIFSFMKKI